MSHLMAALLAEFPAGSRGADPPLGFTEDPARSLTSRAGMTKEVTFEPVEGPINDLIYGAYRAKYEGSAYLSPMIGAPARAATVKITPRDINA
jgi:hypothetical protein